MAKWVDTGKCPEFLRLKCDRCEHVDSAGENFVKAANKLFEGVGAPDGAKLFGKYIDDEGSVFAIVEQRLRKSPQPVYLIDPFYRSRQHRVLNGWLSPERVKCERGNNSITATVEVSSQSKRTRAKQVKAGAFLLGLRPIIERYHQVNPENKPIVLKLGILHADTGVKLFDEELAEDSAAAMLADIEDLSDGAMREWSRCSTCKSCSFRSACSANTAGTLRAVQTARYPNWAFERVTAISQLTEINIDEPGGLRKLRSMLHTLNNSDMLAIALAWRVHPADVSLLLDAHLNGKSVKKRYAECPELPALPSDVEVLVTLDTLTPGGWFGVRILNQFMPLKGFAGELTKHSLDAKKQAFDLRMCTNEEVRRNLKLLHGHARENNLTFQIVARDFPDASRAQSLAAEAGIEEALHPNTARLNGLEAARKVEQVRTFFGRGIGTDEGNAIARSIVTEAPYRAPLVACLEQAVLAVFFHRDEGVAGGAVHSLLEAFEPGYTPPDADTSRAHTVWTDAFKRRPEAAAAVLDADWAATIPTAAAPADDAGSPIERDILQEGLAACKLGLDRLRAESGDQLVGINRVTRQNTVKCSAREEYEVLARGVVSELTDPEHKEGNACDVLRVVEWDELNATITFECVLQQAKEIKNGSTDRILEPFDDFFRTRLDFGLAHADTKKDGRFRADRRKFVLCNYTEADGQTNHEKLNFMVCRMQQPHLRSLQLWTPFVSTSYADWMLKNRWLKDSLLTVRRRGQLRTADAIVQFLDPRNAQLFCLATQAANTPENKPERAMRELSKSWYSKDLTEDQWSAVEKAWTKKVSAIVGPPGTGKTYVLQRILTAFQAMKAKNQTMHVAVVGENHTAINNVMEGITQTLDSHIRARTFIHQFSSTSVFSNLDAVEVVARTNIQWPKTCIVGLTAFSKLLKHPMEFLIDATEQRLDFCLPSEFDVIVVDEAAKLPASALCNIVERLKKDNGRLVICGDPLQLIADRDNLLSWVLRDTAGERVDFTETENIKRDLDPSYITKLTQPFRCPPAVQDLTEGLYSRATRPPSRGTPARNLLVNQWPEHAIAPRSFPADFGAWLHAHRQLTGLLTVLVPEDFTAVSELVIGHLHEALTWFRVGGADATMRLLQAKADRHLHRETVASVQGCEVDVIVLNIDAYSPWLVNINTLNVAFTRAKCLVVLILPTDFKPSWLKLESDAHRVGYRHLKAFVQKSVKCTVSHCEESSVFVTPDGTLEPFDSGLASLSQTG
ncbi:DNA replication ATP-dependent helicase/nuclease DNA2 [Diplonema papillatum]|nr:DNA replication ATP-dependent helicase/nuclease DNA2 [Diplonema papillatum]